MNILKRIKPWQWILIAAVLLGACEKKVTTYIIDQETDLHWSCVKSWSRASTIWTLVDPECDQGLFENGSMGLEDCEWESVPDTIRWTDTVLVHSTGTIEDASAKCYTLSSEGLRPVPGALDTCYCLEEFVD